MLTAALWYLEVLVDQEQDFSEWVVIPEADSFDPQALEVLRMLQAMAAGTRTEDPDAGGSEARFAAGQGRAFIGFSESLYGLGDAADDVVFRRFSLSEQDDIPVMYADIASVNAGIAEEKRALAVELLNLLTGREALVTASAPAQEEQYPQYLLTARAGVYDDLAESYPLYGDLKALAPDPDCRVFVVRPSGREMIAQALSAFSLPPAA